MSPLSRSCLRWCETAGLLIPIRVEMSSTHFLSVTEDIEKFHPHRIAELLQHFRDFLKILTGGNAVVPFIFDIPAGFLFYAIHILHINIKQWLLEYTPAQKIFLDNFSSRPYN